MVCCVCLLENQNTMAIFNDSGQQLNIAGIVNKHFWFKVQHNDLLTTQICGICWHKINDFHEFYQTVERAHKEFQQNHYKSNTVIKEETVSTIKLEQHEQIFKDDLNQLELEIDNNHIDQQTGNTINLKNPLDDQYDSDAHDLTKKECDTSDNYEPSEISEHDSCTNEEISKDVKPKNKQANTIVKKRAKRKALMKQEKNKDSYKKKKNRFDPILTEEMILKHIPMGCDLCVFVGKTFHDIVLHFKKEHPKVRAYITCCNRKFLKRCFIAEHAMTHENPNCFRCEECNKSFKTVENLQNHNIKSHAPEEECTFECDLCPKKFAREHFLQVHKTSHIPKEQWEFFCTKCPTQKAFASENLLNFHDINIHKRPANICNVCAKEIKNKTNFEKHVRSHYEQSGPRIKCPLTNCESWLKDEDNLKKHIKDIHNIAGKTYKCPECERICPNPRSLSRHKSNVHSNEMFKCQHCDKIFKKAISLREHLAKHTGEMLYSCPHCPRTFNSNSYMYTHIKSTHLLEWQEARRQKAIGGS